MRIAILINGELVAAPVVNARLGRKFVVEGLNDVAEDLDFFCWKIQGKSDEEIAELLRTREAAENKTPVAAREKPEYFSDGEYAVLKKVREKQGIFYLDNVPDEQELEKCLKVGTSDEDVVREFGHAFSRSTDAKGLPEDLRYDLAPELRTVERKMRPDGFIVCIENGKVSSWGLTWTDAPKQGKSKSKEPRRLIVKPQEFEMGDKRFGMIRWVEELQLSLNKGEIKPHAQDYADLISLVINVASSGDASSMIDSHCSVLSILAENFSEVADLRKPGEEGINLFTLRDALIPYLHGEKQFPSDVAQPGK